MKTGCWFTNILKKDLERLLRLVWRGPPLCQF